MRVFFLLRAEPIDRSSRSLVRSVLLRPALAAISLKTTRNLLGKWQMLHLLKCLPKFWRIRWCRRPT
ncbi:hypothetical protein NDU88_006598 [Pleurodeles waltl]|uniref:Uncharacterized protein n=1 Tax=Pleurodeles waltl TaxID=8319 RepID=A0AAV7NQS8_PLEWA|nr:hypothetical protein NDU88_006598 [Pleurodeles waltl]